MENSKKLSCLLLVTLSIIISTFNFSFAASLQRNDVAGFLKVAGSAALKEDGSIWTIPRFDNIIYNKIGEGFVDIDTDFEGTSYTALKKDGSLLAWGSNAMGQLAQKSIEMSNDPVKIMDDVKAVSGLTALKKDGSVWIWGGDIYYAKSSKVNTPKMIYQGAKAVAYGSPYILIIDRRNILYGIANVNSTVGAELKVKKIKISENVRFVNKNLFIKDDKTLWKFTIDELGRVQSEHVLKHVRYADSDYVSNCAVKEDGTLWVWGFSDDNIPDRLKGYGNNPQKVMSGVKYARCAIQSVIAVKNDGSLLGLGAICPRSNYSIPKTVMKNVKKVYDNGLVLKEDNSLWRIEHYPDGAQEFLILDNVKNVSDDSVIEKEDGTKWLYYYNYTTNTYSIKEFNNKLSALEGDLGLDDDGALSILKNDESTGELYFKKVLQDFGEIKKLYSCNHFIYIVMMDNSLWILLKEELPLYSPETINKYKKPVKILENVKEVTFVASYGFAITYKDELLTWRIDPLYTTNDQTVPQKVMEGVECFDSIKYSSVDIIKKDKSHWYFTSGDFEWDAVKENFAGVISKSAVKDIDNMDEIIMHTPNVYIKKNGELWVRGFGWPYWDNPDFSKPLKFSKVMDNVKYADGSYFYGISICTDGSLWEFGETNNAADNKDENAKINSIKPRKLLDNVKEVHLGNGNTALLEDGSFYTWGISDSGQLGIESTGIVEKPQKILDDVVWSGSGPYDTSILKKDGTLLHSGCGFAIGHERPYVKNPMNLGITSGEAKIQHINYESVGINEDIDVLVKINDPAYSKDVKLVLQGGEELPMEMTTNCYYNAVIPGVNKTGRIIYGIKAFDSNGNSISSGEYSVEVLSNDVVMIDSQIDEVIEANFKIFVNGSMLVTDTKPVIKQGRTLVPVRAISEALKAEVTWNEKSKTVSIKKGSKTISFKPVDKVMMVNGRVVKIDVPAVILNSRVVLPLRTICEMLGAQVNWAANEKKIEIAAGE